MSDQGWDGNVADTGPPADGPPTFPTTPTSRPGWYVDPWGSTHHRYWNGQSWTADTFPNGPATPELSSPASTGAAPPAPGSWSGTEQAAPPPEWSAHAPYLGWVGPPPPGPGIGQPDDEAPPPPKSGRAAFVGALIVGLVIGFGVVTGFVLTVDRHHRSNEPSAASATPQQPGTTQPPLFNPGGSGNPPAPTDPSASVLPGIVIQQAEVPAGTTVLPVPGGDQVSDGESSTLDICNGAFASEALRTARLQVAALDGQNSIAEQTEAVLYANPAATAQAFTELKAAQANCPSTPVTSPIGEPTTTTKFNAAPDGAWPQTPTVDRLAFDLVRTDQSGRADHSVAVYLRRGRVLMGVYFSQPDAASQSAVAGQTTIAGIVNVFATRIAQLPASVVNGG
jgi:hypothetical protein